jgi:putative transcriptional regulator
LNLNFGTFGPNTGPVSPHPKLLEKEGKENPQGHAQTRIGVETMKKRNLFNEITEGFDALREERLGKRTLRTHTVEPRPVIEITAAELVALRERLQLSRPVLAHYLRTNPRTLENWEQGRAKPNAQAALLIRLVERYPDTVERLAEV